MSDDRKDGPPPAEGLPPFFPMVEDGSAMIRNFGSHSHGATSSTTGIFVPPLPLVEAASLLLQTVIVRGGRTNEGTLIEAVALPWFDIIDFLKTDPSLAFLLPCEIWE